MTNADWFWCVGRVTFSWRVWGKKEKKCKKNFSRDFLHRKTSFEKWRYFILNYFVFKLWFLCKKQREEFLLMWQLPRKIPNHNPFSTNDFFLIFCVLFEFFSVDKDFCFEKKINKIKKKNYAKIQNFTPSNTFMLECCQYFPLFLVCFILNNFIFQCVFFYYLFTLN